MRRASFLVLALSTFLALIAAPSFATASAEQKLEIDFETGSQKRASIDLRDSDLVDVLKFLSTKGQFNIFISKQVQGRVTLLLQDVRIIDILDIILLSNGLAYYEQNNIVYVMTQEEYRQRYGGEYGDARQVKWLRLQYASPGQIFKMLEPTKSKVGSIVVDEQSGTLIIMEMPEKMKFMLEIVRELDKPLETRAFDLSYAKAADVQALVKSQFAAGGEASVQADARSNQIFVTALPHRMEEIATMVAKADRKTREVAIDAQIVKVVLNEDNVRGIDWRLMFQRGLLEPLDLNVNLPATLTSFGSVTYSTFSSDGFEAVYNFLDTLGESKILASPRLTVVEAEEAKILIGTREAYVTTTTTTGGAAVVSTAESISFIDVGISLRVSALINKEGYVNMKIKPEVSSVVRTLTTPSLNEIPIVDTTQAETRVLVKDGTTIVIGGLRKDEKKRTSNRIPGLSKLPVLGALFRDEDIELEQSELVVFLTPHIIEGDKNMITYEHVPSAKGVQAYPYPPDGKDGSPAATPATDTLSSAPSVHRVPAELEIKGLEAYSAKSG